MPTALMRGVSSSINRCELTYLGRECIRVAEATRQHLAYKEALEQSNVEVIDLPEMHDLPDAVFVQDNATVLDEVAVVSRMGRSVRQPEVPSVASRLAQYRPLAFLRPPAALEGGDVIRVGRTLYVGLSGRTNLHGVNQLRQITEPFGYRVEPVEVKGCLHLTTACSFVGRNVILANTDWVDVGRFEGVEVVGVPPAEPFAGNTVLVGDTVILPSSAPQTYSLLEGRGYKLRAVDISEFHKAEGGLSCLSIIF